jgi:hypothetical protein
VQRLQRQCCILCSQPISISWVYNFTCFWDELQDGAPVRLDIWGINP